jgi:hypothetical protein
MTKPSNGRFTKSNMAPTRSTEAGDQRDASHARPPPTNGQDPPPRKDPRQTGSICSEYAGPKGPEDGGAHIKTAAMEKPAAEQPDTKIVTRPPPI